MWHSLDMDKQAPSLIKVWENVTPWMDENTADRMRSRRQAMGITQKEAAEACGIAQGTYSKVETYRLKRPPIRVGDLCRLLQLTPVELLGEQP